MSSKVTKPKKIFASRHRLGPWTSNDSRAFKRAYARLGDQGFCDSVGGCEYMRVKEEWKTYKGPMDLDTFIKIRANLGCSM